MRAAPAFAGDLVDGPEDCGTDPAPSAPAPGFFFRRRFFFLAGAAPSVAGASSDAGATADWAANAAGAASFDWLFSR